MVVTVVVVAVTVVAVVVVVVVPRRVIQGEATGHDVVR